MKRIITLILLLVIVQTISNAQSRKKKGNSIYAGTSLNYNPPIEPYSFLNTFTADQDQLILTFLTSNSGTFEINEDNLINVDRELAVTFPSQLISIGANIQIVSQSGLFHEISLTKLSLSKSSYIKSYSYHDMNDSEQTFQLGYEQTTSAIGIRYELGRYFGRQKKAKMKFGLSGAIEPSFYRFKRKSLSIKEFPISANIFTLNIALIPMVSVKLSKKLLLEFKIIPNILIADFEKVNELNPTLSVDKHAGVREYNLPEIAVGGSITLKYLIKEPKKRKRKAKKETTEEGE